VPERGNAADVIAGDALGLRSGQHGRILRAGRRGQFFKLTSRSLAIRAQTTVPPAFTISVLSSRARGKHRASASAACMPMRSVLES
jgi:hypothetical protein